MRIQSKAQLRAWLDQDLAQYKINGEFPERRWRWWDGLQFPLIAWQRTLRRAEYVTNTRRGRPWRPYVLLWKAYFLRKSLKMNLEIPLNVFGPGLTVAHYANVVVNGGARVGANCRVHPGVCLGDSKGASPVLGNDVYLGNGAVVVGEVYVGSRVKIGPHALVRESVESGAIVVGTMGKKLIRRPKAEESSKVPA